MRNIGSFRPSEIRPVVLALVREDEHGGIEAGEPFYNEVAGKLDSEYTGSFYMGYDGRRGAEKFAGQVGTVLRKLAADGDLIAVKNGRSNSYYTPQQRAKLELKRKAQADEEAASIERWAAISRRLAAAGYEHQFVRAGRGIWLGTDGWERLLGELEARRQIG